MGHAEIDVAALAGCQQRTIAREHRRDANLLLAEIPVHQSAARRRRDQKPQPLGRAKYKLRGAGGVARRSWCR